eukprot:TRINITY_DN2247_c0_g1_i7.p1 TRINITY_DN2247_c0_g1~~TRINITY_DN2247_c0_g1_i7.p1  ORF type:complete len:217 (-),score=36.17 TRINITY_DN2247_c0_g1_i7:319-969(-)
MAPPRRRNKFATKRVPNLGRQNQRLRLQKIGNSEQWATLMKKSEQKLVLVCFYTELSFGTRRMQQYLLELSKHKTIGKRTIFVEANPDDLRDVSNMVSLSSYPALGFYFNGTLRQLMQGAEPQAIQDSIEGHICEIWDTRGRKKWKKWAVGGVVAATAVLMGAVGMSLNGSNGGMFGGKSKVINKWQDLDFSDSEWSDEEGLGYQSQLDGLRTLEA